MDISLHYLTMANQMLIQKRLLERVKASGLTLGQPKVLDYLKSHDGASQKPVKKARSLWKKLLWRLRRLHGKIFLQKKQRLL